jgi:hypothetical protein
MNKDKIKKLIDAFVELERQDALTEQEYLVYVANLLFAFGKAGMQADSRISNVNWNDPALLDSALDNYPDSVHLAALLQAHAILYWSKGI